MTNISAPAPRIAVLDRGFIYVGHCSLDAGLLTITDARCVRRWGTSSGLGELARLGPRERTKLDPVGTVQAPAAAVIHLIDCQPDAWAGILDAAK